MSNITISTSCLTIHGMIVPCESPIEKIGAILVLVLGGDGFEMV